MFNTLTDRLGQILNKIKGRGILTQEMVDEAMREIKIALLEADVALPVVKSFINTVKEQAVGQNIIKSVQPAQQVVKIVHDALVQTLDDGDSALKTAAVSPTVLLMVGLQGSGKTTSSAKLAARLRKDGKKVLMASLDIYRPAAQEQLAGLGTQIGVDTIPIIAGQKPLDITKRALDEAKKGAYDVLILDTAGRLHVDDEMMDEVRLVADKAHPTETLLVVDSLTGQDAVHVADSFHAALPLTGVILTRVDGDARGGAALSMKAVTGCPIKFLGMGEKTDALEAFDAKRVAGRILGMGDVVGLVETAIEKVNQEDAVKMAERMMKGQFDMNDMLSQLQQIKNLGDVKGFMMMIPGMAKFREKIEQANIDNSIFKRQEAIILSMTPFERRHPDVLKASRKLRIAKGAGVTVNDVNKLVKQYEQMAQAMKKFKKMGPLGSLSAMKGLFGGNPLMNKGGFPPFNM